MRELLVIANAKAGTAADEAVRAVEAVLRREATIEVVRPEGPDDLDAVLDERHGRELVVLGGDGSLHLVVAALHRREELADAVIALVPMGTGNDFARTVGIPTDPTAAAELALTCDPRPIDLVVDASGGVVVNAVHLGVGALAGDAATELKPRLGKLAYVAGAIKAGVRTSGWRVRVVADGVELVDRRTKVLLVGLGNGATVGGGTKLAPHARLDDGAVDVVVSRSVSPLARLAFAVQMKRGKHGGRDDVTVLRAREVQVEGGPIPINADGEIGDPISRGSWRVTPAAWFLRAPAGGSRTVS